MWAAGLKESTPKAKHVRKLLSIGVTPAIEILQYVTDPDEAVPPLLKLYEPGIDASALDDAEQRWIAYGRAAGWPLTNLTDGGDGLRGLDRTPEHCAKISASRIGNQWSKGIPKSPEHRAKLSAALKGKIRSPEHAAKTGAANRGRKHRPETIAKMKAAAGSGPTHWRYGQKASPETIEKLRLSHLGKAHSAEHRAKISAAMLGERNHAFGKPKSEETKKRISSALAGKLSGSKHPMFGKQHSEYSKRKTSETKKLRLSIGRRLAFLLAGI